MRERRHLAPNEENDFSVMDTRQDRADADRHHAYTDAAT